MKFSCKSKRKSMTGYLLPFEDIVFLTDVFHRSFFRFKTGKRRNDSCISASAVYPYLLAQRPEINILFAEVKPI